jgi:hypothetical protein
MKPGPEADFASAIEQALGGGVDPSRLMDLVLQRWKDLDLASWEERDRLVVEGSTAKDNHEPIVTMTWGPLRGNMTPTGARATALTFLMAAETAETGGFILGYFAKAKDQALAKKLVADIMPKLAGYKKQMLDEAIGPEKGASGG